VGLLGSAHLQPDHDALVVGERLLRNLDDFGHLDSHAELTEDCQTRDATRE
jgi:hypothetical protein